MRKINALGDILASRAFESSTVAENKSMDIVELFTSQGCSYCPPVDALVKNLAKSLVF